ncbi:MAG: M20/M25/M40 family metallo-hydrolase [Alistipes onderdonkii]
MHPGVMHACGHDMHAAVLFGVLQQLAAEPDFRGTLFGLFQPGEECNPGGASLVLAEKPVRRVRGACRGGRARRAATGGRDAGIPRREIHGLQRRTALLGARYGRARRHAPAVEKTP